MVQGSQATAPWKSIPRPRAAEGAAEEAVCSELSASSESTRAISSPDLAQAENYFPGTRIWHKQTAEANLEHFFYVVRFSSVRKLRNVNPGRAKCRRAIWTVHFPPHFCGLSFLTMTRLDNKAPGNPASIAARRRRSWKFKLTALGFGTLLSGLLIELTLRMVGVGFPNLFEPDYHCGSRLRKSTSGVWTSEGFGQVRVNSLGFRGPEVSLQKPPNVFRICVLGDSFIEALQVHETETFCAQLQARLGVLKPSEAAAREIEVINCGVSGYGTAQELLMLTNYVLPLQPDIVLLAVFPENDIRNNSRTLDGAETRPYFTLSESGELIPDFAFRTSHSWLVGNSDYERTKAGIVNRFRTLQLLQELRRPKPDRPATANDVDSILASSVRDNWYVYRAPESAQSPEGEAWSVTERLLQELDSECRKNAVRLMVFSVPTPIQIWPAREERNRIADDCGIEDLFYSEKRLQSLCDQYDVPFLTLASRMQSEAESRSTHFAGFENSTLGVGHWNQEGNTVAAEMVFTWLSEYLSKLDR